MILAVSHLPAMAGSIIAIIEQFLIPSTSLLVDATNNNGELRMSAE
jgi:hypothetical protein